jgi:hypothetical protein
MFVPGEAKRGTAHAGPRRALYFAKSTDSEASMAVAKKKLKTFHASVQVTRVEDWCVEAETAEEAHDLLLRGQGERTRLGDCVYLEVQDVSE